MYVGWRSFCSVFLAAAVLGGVACPFGGVAQTDSIIAESFDVGSLDTSFWNDAWGSYPAVVPDDAEHGYVLLFLSSAGTQQVIATPYALSAFDSDDVLALSIDVRRNHDSCWFGLYPAYDQPPSGGPYGFTPTLSTMWGIPYSDYSAGIADDPLYPTPAGDPQGFVIKVPSEQTTHPSSGSQDKHLAPYTLQVGQWYRLDLRYSSDSFTFLVDQAELLSLGSSQLYYTFAQPDDWLFMLGDGGTNAYQPTNLSVDNILLVRTKAAIMAVMDTFAEESPYDPLSVERVDGWYNTFGPEVLFEALANCGGEYSEFVGLLDAYARKMNDPLAMPEPRLVLTYMKNESGVVALGIENRGDAPCCGEASSWVGLSYCTSWIPEWCTIFQNTDYGEICLLPGESIDLEFALEPVPQDCRAAFAEQLETMWTGYVDPDPSDYLGVVFSLGSEQCCGFLPDAG